MAADPVKEAEALRKEVHDRVMKRMKAEPEWANSVKDSIVKGRVWQAEQRAAEKEWEGRVMAARTEGEMEAALAEGPPQVPRPGSWSTADGSDERVQEAATMAERAAMASVHTDRLKTLPMMAILNHLIAGRHVCFKQAFQAHTCDAMNKSATEGDPRACREARNALSACSASLYSKVRVDCPSEFGKLRSCLESKGSTNVLDCQADLLAFDRCTEDYTP